jgi:hypothetical protein
MTQERCPWCAKRPVPAGEKLCYHCWIRADATQRQLSRAMTRISLEDGARRLVDTGGCAE